MSSRIGYAGLVLATGLGWLLLLDLSANGHPVNRYLALYHQGHLWLGMLVFSVLLFLRQPLSHGLGWMLSVAGEAARAFGPAARAARARGRAAAADRWPRCVLFGLSLSNLRQLTSELGRVWLIVGAAWFFFLRAGPLAERLARAGPARRLVLALCLAAAVRRRGADRGDADHPRHGAAADRRLRRGRLPRRDGGDVVAPAQRPRGLGLRCWRCCCSRPGSARITLALFRLGAVDSVTAARLESLAAPFASTNDQLALVTWFQRAAPAQGFGIGAVPWCGYATAGRCSGVPAQIHSDYTFTAIVGVFGATAAWAAALGCAVWLHRLIRHHGRVTRGEPRFVARAGHARATTARRCSAGSAWPGSC